MSKLVGLGVVGCGSIAKAAHLPAIAALSDKCELVAVCDCDLVRAEEVGRQYGTPAFGSFAELLEVPEVQAVIVATPNDQHCDSTMRALKSGRHVLCEKPLGLNAGQADAMCLAASLHGLVLQVGLQLRFSPAALELKRRVEAGELGTIYYIRAHALRRRGVPGWGSFIDRTKQGGGPLIDIGVHLLDLALWYLGHPNLTCAAGATWNRLGTNPSLMNPWGDYDRSAFTIEDMGAGFLCFENRSAVSIESSFMANVKENSFEIHVFGDRGGALLRPVAGAGGQLEIYTEVDRQLVDLNVATAAGRDMHEAALDEFLASVKTGRPSPIPGEHGRALNEAIDALYSSACPNP